MSDLPPENYDTAKLRATPWSSRDPRLSPEKDDLLARIKIETVSKDKEVESIAGALYVSWQAGSRCVLASSIYKSTEGRAEILAAYERSLDRFPLDVEERFVKTRFGETHVLMCGRVDGPPLINFHGGNYFNAETLQWYTRLADTYRMVAPDTIGHPGKSAETRLSPKDLSYGEWAADVLDDLGIEAVRVVGSSYGAGVALRLAALAPNRVVRAALVIPSGIVMPKTWPMLSQMLAPLFRYKLSPSRRNAIRVVQPLCVGGEVEAPLAEAVDLIFRHVKIESGMPRKATKDELAAYRAPTLVLAGEQDILFTASRVLPRAEEIIQNVKAEMIPGSGHMPTPETVRFISDRVTTFFTANEGTQ